MLFWGRTWLEYVHGVASTVHQCVKFIHKGQVIKIQSTPTPLLGEDLTIPTLTLAKSSSLSPIVKPVLSILKLSPYWAYPSRLVVSKSLSTKITLSLKELE